MKFRIIRKNGKYYVQRKKSFLGWKIIDISDRLEWAEEYMNRHIKNYQDKISPIEVVKEVEVTE